MNWTKYYLVQGIAPPRGGGGYSTNVYTGRFHPEDYPFTLYIPFFHEKGTPFVYLLCEKKKKN